MLSFYAIGLVSRDVPLKVLLVKDNPASGQLVQEMLEGGLYELIHLANVKSALAYLAKKLVDVVLLDLSVADGNGLKALSQLHKQQPSVAIVVICELKDEAIAQKALQMGAREYLIQGQINTQLLVRVLRYAIERQQWAKNCMQ